MVYNGIDDHSTENIRIFRGADALHRQSALGPYGVLMRNDLEVV